MRWKSQLDEWLYCLQISVSTLTLIICRCQKQDIPISLMYGKEDPWVTPYWGIRVKQQVPEAPYYEISPAGHCPHDEVPEVTIACPVQIIVPLCIIQYTPIDRS